MIVALQYHTGDLERTMSLARLLADVEPRPRSDVLLALVCQPGTTLTPLVEKTAAHCRRVFPVELATSEYGAQGAPEGCTALWRGTVKHFFEQSATHYHPDYDYLAHHGDSLLTLDGGDGVPLHREWIDQVNELHLETRASGKLITGSPYYLGTCPLHVNPNAVFELSLFVKEPRLLEPIEYDGTLATHFDVYHREAMLEHASLSSVVRTDWRGGGRPATRQLMSEASAEHVWLHGYKDPDLYWTAREHLLDAHSPPEVKRYQLEQLLLHEEVRRSLEKSWEKSP